MTVKNFAKFEQFTPLCLPEAEREVSGAYCGDLLSWVMGRAQADNAWLTIMSNVNVIAVASLSDVSCVILCEGVTLPDDVKETAESKGINVLSSSLPIFETAMLISGNV